MTTPPSWPRAPAPGLAPERARQSSPLRTGTVGRVRRSRKVTIPCFVDIPFFSSMRMAVKWMGAWSEHQPGSELDGAGFHISGADLVQEAWLDHTAEGSTGERGGELGEHRFYVVGGSLGSGAAFLLLEGFFCLDVREGVGWLFFLGLFCLPPSLSLSPLPLSLPLDLPSREVWEVLGHHAC